MIQAKLYDSGAKILIIQLLWEMSLTSFRVVKPPEFLDIFIITANHAVSPLICDLHVIEWGIELPPMTFASFIIYSVIYKQLALEEDSAMVPAGE